RRWAGAWRRWRRADAPSVVLGRSAERHDGAFDGAARLEHLLLVGERVGIAVLGGGAQAVVGEVTQVGLDRLQPFDEVFGVTHRGAPVRRARGRRPAARRGGGRRWPPRPRAPRNRGLRGRRPYSR